MFFLTSVACRKVAPGVQLTLNPIKSVRGRTTSPSTTGLHCESPKINRIRNDNVKDMLPCEPLLSLCTCVPCIKTEQTFFTNSFETEQTMLNSNFQFVWPMLEITLFMCSFVYKQQQFWVFSQLIMRPAPLTVLTSIHFKSVDVLFNSSDDWEE